MAESGCIDCSKAKQHAAGEPVAADNAISAAGSTAERPSMRGDFLGQCCLGADVSFLVGGDKFHAHRAVLAAGSPVFKGLLFSPTTAAAASSTDDGIGVHGVEPETFRALLRFMYADDALPGDDEIEGAATTAEMLRNLAAAADMF